MLSFGIEAIDAAGDLSAQAVAAERFREHALLRTLQIVGEAAAQARTIDDRLNDIPGLRNVIGLRNILVHGYAKIDLTEVVLIVRTDLPPLLAAVKAHLAEDSEP